MFFPYQIAERARCSDKHKNECRLLILQMAEMAEKARREGILALEDDIESLTDPFLKKGLQLVVDGTDPDYVKDMLLTTISFSNYKGKELLEKCIITRGILSLSAGDNPRVVTGVLTSLLGEQGLDFSYDTHSEGEFFRFLKSLQENPAAEPRCSLDRLLYNLDEYGVQKILRELDSYVLVKALHGLTDTSKQVIFKNMSVRAGVLLLEDYKFMQGHLREEDITECHLLILNIYKKLVEMGEVVGDISVD